MPSDNKSLSGSTTAMIVVDMQNALAGIAEYVTEPPLIREGELVWLYQFNV